MSDNTSILQELRENNPFMSSVSPASPFDNKNSDLVQLNSNTSEEIEQLILNKRRNPEMPVAGLVLGEAGSGKTHMLARILRRVRDNARPIIFVAVKTAKAFTNPETITQDLWSEIFISLSQLHSNKRSQFDMLLSRMMDSYHECRINDGFTDLTKLEPRLYLAKDMREINKDFLKCLLLYLGANDEFTKLKIFEWLCDGLEDEESLSLGLPPRKMTGAECEATARKFMLSLGYVLAYAKVSMVICFDQLEPLREKNFIHLFGDTISFMMNDINGIIPLCFSRADIWNSILRPELDSSVVQRLEHHKMTMKNCSPAQSRLLVKNRLASAFKDGVEEKYNWLIKRMNNLIVSDCSPRMVIQLADHVITHAGPGTDAEEIINTFRNIYESEYTRILDKPNTWLPNAEHLTAALELWLTSHIGFETSAGDGKYIRILGSYNDKRYAFTVITSKNNSTAVAAIKRCVAFQNEYKSGVCFYVTEAKTHKTTWKKFWEQQAAFEEMGGKIIILDNKERACWYALVSLINQVKSEDVNLYLSSGNRTANLNDLQEFIYNIELIPGIFTEKKINMPVKPVDSQKVLPVDAEMLRLTLSGIIKSSPMKLLSADKALTLLAGRKLKISHSSLLDFVNSNKNSFRVYKSRSGETMIGITSK